MEPVEARKKWILLAFNATSWFAVQPDGCRTKVHKLKLGPVPTSPGRIGGRISFILEILHPAYSTMGVLLSEPWREARRRMSERQEQRAGVGPMTSFERRRPRPGEKERT